MQQLKENILTDRARIFTQFHVSTRKYFNIYKYSNKYSTFDILQKHCTFALHIYQRDIWRVFSIFQHFVQQIVKLQNASRRYKRECE